MSALRRLADVQLRDDARVRHDPGVRGQDSRDVLPEKDSPRRKRAREERRRQVGSAASERRDTPVRSGAEKPGDDRDDAFSQKRLEDPADIAVGFREKRGRRAEAAVGGDQIERADPRGRLPRRRQARGEDPRGDFLSAREDRIERRRAQVLEKNGSP